MRSKIRALTVVAAVMMLCACGTDDAAISSGEHGSRTAQACDADGNCGKPCPQIEPCEDGYAWDSRSCGCRPDRGRGGPPTQCGPSLTCRGTEICCVDPDPTFPTYFCSSSGVCPL